MRRNKGISLIVLVITIIVMIILAGSIIITLSNSGIINKANEAVDLTNDKQMQEYITSELILNGWYSGKPITKELLDEIDGVTVSEAKVGDKVVPGTWIVEKDGAKTTIYETGDIVKGEVEIWDGTSVEVPEIKEGNWYIYTPAQFKFFAGYVNNTSEAEGSKTLTAEQMALVPAITKETTVNLMADLDMGARQENGELKVGTKWIPIGPENTDTGKFIGTFDGNNHMIRGVYVSITNPDTKFVGIFGNSNTIKNLTVKDSYIKAQNNCVGGIVGALREGDLINCYNINTQVISTGKSIGGVVGQFTGKEIKDCHNINNNKIEGNCYCGGIVGYSAVSTTIINCTNNGEILVGDLDDFSGSGGIVGYFEGLQIDNCINSGNVEGASRALGGIIGINIGENSTITNCTNNGNVTADDFYVGGIVGNQNKTGTIKNCINNGKILCQAKEKSTWTGGICGWLNSSSGVNSCTNNGNVINMGGRTGGIVGESYQNSKITNCINTSLVQSSNDGAGGIVGVLAGTVEKCYNTGNIKSTGSSTNVSIGGIVGGTINEYTHIIRNTYNTGTIIVEGNDVNYISGIVGLLSAGTANVTVTNNYNLGRIQITGIGADKISGIASKSTNEGGTFNISNNYYLQGITTATLNDIGEAKTSAEMKTLDFVKLLGETVWQIRGGENSGFPVLIGLK